ncbi:MAG: hypothetical protein WCH62_00995, partial [Candidatus Omnitrophota bacterium]
IGKQISMIANKNDVVFLKSSGWYSDPRIVYYAHKNLALWKGQRKGQRLLEKNKSDRGVIFTLDDKGKQVVNVEYIYRKR